MNQFGHNFRLAIWGESHGTPDRHFAGRRPGGHPLSEEDFAGTSRDAAAERPARRRGANPTYRRSCRSLRRLHDGRAADHRIPANTNTHSQDYSTVMRHYRPSHADLVAYHKFAGFNDPRGGGHFSARLTVALVAAGVVAKKMLPASIRFATRLTEIGGCTDPERFNEVLHAAAADRDSVGGIVECRVQGVPLGLGQPFFDSAESMIAHLLFAVPRSRGPEFGSGFAGSASARLGEQRLLHRLRRHDGDQQRRGHQRRHHQRQRDRGARGAETHAEHRPQQDHHNLATNRVEPLEIIPPRRLRRPCPARWSSKPPWPSPWPTSSANDAPREHRRAGRTAHGTLRRTRSPQHRAGRRGGAFGSFRRRPLLTDRKRELAVERAGRGRSPSGCGRPVATVVGHTEFYGRRFAVREGF